MQIGFFLLLLENDIIYNAYVFIIYIERVVWYEFRD